MFVITPPAGFGALSGTAASGHANIGTARKKCAGHKGRTLSDCMSAYFNRYGVKCVPKAKTCHGKKRHHKKRGKR